MTSVQSMLVGFKRHLRAETVPAEAVYLISGTEVTALAGRSIERLAPLLDGTRSLAEVERDAMPHLAATEIQGLLDRLSEANLIEFRPTVAEERDTAADAYWSLAGLDSDTAARAVRSARVQVISMNGIDAESARTALEASGVTLAPVGDNQAELSFVLCEDYLDPGLVPVNLAQLTTGRPWLLAKLSGPQPWIGPVFRPGEGACWACLAKRLQENRYGELIVRRALGSRGSPPETSVSVGRTVSLHIAVLEAVKWLAGMRYPGQQAVSILDTFTMNRGLHPVTRRPQCPACGDPGLVTERVKRPIVFISRSIVARDRHGQRALTHEQMLARYAHLVDPVTGIVAELRRDQRSPEFLHAYLSGRNRAMAVPGITSFTAGLRAFSGGKGTTQLEAQAGALCEAVERYSGTLCGDEPTVRDSYRRLGSVAVNPADCLLFDERQFAGRTQWNATCSPFHRVPEPFDENAAIDWTPVWSLRTGRQRLLPTAMLYFSPSNAPKHPSVPADSNGNAAGSTLEDAILHGFFELVERDAVALWWYNRTRHPLVSLESFDDAWIARLPELYRRLRREIWVIDVTSDLGIPVMAAVSRRTDKAAQDIMLGFGAHANPLVAVRRALAELGQLLPAVAGVRADGTGYALDHPHLKRWWTQATVQNQPYLRPDLWQPVRTAADYRYRPSATVDLDLIHTATARTSLDVLVLDQTRPDINMPVVKVVVPGLRHFWPRFAPGRIFDIPVALGRQAEPTAYADLNPIPLFI